MSDRYADYDSARERDLTREVEDHLDWGDPKPAARVVDRDATRRKTILDPNCRACGRPAGSGHHLLPKGERGDDFEDNIIPVCGDGTKGCHGALHGTPYTVVRGGRHDFDRRGAITERRDSTWVRQRIAARLRPEEFGYLIVKLGEAAARDYLVRVYHYAGEPPC